MEGEVDPETGEVVGYESCKPYTGRPFAAERWWIDENSSDKIILNPSYIPSDSQDLWVEEDLSAEYTGYMVIGEGAILHQRVDQRMAHAFDEFTPFVSTTDGEAEITYDKDSRLVTITGRKNGTCGAILLEWAALYPGTFTEAPRYRPKPYAEEYANCLRYRREIDLLASPLFGIVNSDETSINFIIPLEAPMAGEIDVGTYFTYCKIYSATGSVKSLNPYSIGVSAMTNTSATIVFRFSETVGTANSIVYMKAENPPGHMLLYVPDEYEGTA